MFRRTHELFPPTFNLHGDKHIFFLPIVCEESSPSNPILTTKPTTSLSHRAWETGGIDLMIRNVHCREQVEKNKCMISVNGLNSPTTIDISKHKASFDIDINN